MYFLFLFVCLFSESTNRHIRVVTENLPAEVGVLTLDFTGSVSRGLFASSVVSGESRHE